MVGAGKISVILTNDFIRDDFVSYYLNSDTSCGPVDLNIIYSKKIDISRV